MDRTKNSASAEANPSGQSCRRVQRLSLPLLRHWSYLSFMLAGCSARDADLSALNEPATGASDSIAAEDVADRDTTTIDALDPALTPPGDPMGLRMPSGDGGIDWGNNPFLPPKAQNAQAPDMWARNEAASLAATPSRRWNLKGILARDRKWIAIINQKILAPGDKIDGYRLVAINRDSVTLASNDDTVVLRLK